MKLVLHTRKFFCDTPDCARQIFTERLPEIIAPSARRTQRLDQWFTAVGFAAGGAAGARLLQALGLSATPAILLARIRAYPLTCATTPRALGIDDFAFRRGRRYGTIVVDLDRHRPVDLTYFPTAVLTPWRSGSQPIPARRSSVEIEEETMRDDAVGAREGAPQALQIADRFHLVKNLGELVERIVRRHAQPCLRGGTADRHQSARPFRGAGATST